MEQINWVYLAKHGFRFVGLDDKTLRLNLGKKNMDIEYNEGTDTYRIKKHIIDKDTNVTTEIIDDIYFDDLENIIDEFFGLKGYVRDVRGVLNPSMTSKNINVRSHVRRIK